MEEQPHVGEKRKREEKEAEGEPEAQDAHKRYKMLMRFDDPPRCKKPSEREAKSILSKYRDLLQDKIGRLPLDDTLKRITRHVEWLLSEENLAQDEMLKTKLNDKGGIPASILLETGKIVAVELQKIAGRNNSPPLTVLLRQAIESSSVLSIQPESGGDVVYRKSPFSFASLPKPSLVVELTEPDLESIMQVLRHHPHAEYKIADGVTRIFVKERSLGNICFHVTRLRRQASWDEGDPKDLEEEEDDFSYISCCKSLAQCQRDHLFKALRTAVLDDVQAIGQALWAGKDVITCPISGLQTSKEESDIDHYPIRFCDIVREFIGNVKTESLATKESTKGLGTFELVDKQIEQQFRVLHRKRAQLRVVHKREHQLLNNIENRALSQVEKERGYA